MNLRVETLGILQSEFEGSRMLRPKHTPEMLKSELLRVYPHGSARGHMVANGKVLRSGRAARVSFKTL